MLFSIPEAIKIRNHYYSLLMGQPFSTKNDLKITGVMVSKPQEITKSIEDYLKSNSNDLLPLLPVNNQQAKEYKIYVLADDGAYVYHSELDNKLTELGIAKIY